ncbi:FUSC family protein [Oscillospiraceae bacterium PP1C4]
MRKLPKIGLRMIKSVIAVFLCFMIDYFRGAGSAFYSVIAAILCMQPDVKNSFHVALNRTIGTLIGGAFGLLVLLCMHRFLPDSPPIIQYLIISLALIPLMYLTVLVKKTAATYITCVVFLSITVSHGVDVVPYLFAFNRTADTLIGIFVSLGINSIPFLKNRFLEQ